MKLSRFFAPLAAVLLLAACASIPNPVGKAENLETQAWAAYGVTTVALEAAADIAEDPETPDGVVAQIKRYAPAAAASANALRDGAQLYAQAQAAGDTEGAEGALRAVEAALAELKDPDSPISRLLDLVNENRSV